MKLLKITAVGLPLFEKKCEIDFLATQRVTDENAEKMTWVCSYGKQSFYHNNVLSFIGINASGKTTMLKVIAFVCGLLNNEPLNRIEGGDFLETLAENSTVEFDIVFYTDSRQVVLLHTVIARKNGKLWIVDEYLKSKSLSRVSSKKDFFCFDNEDRIMSRNRDEEFLLDDVSIMVAYNKKNNDHLVLVDMLRYTNDNQLSISEDCPLELIEFFDPSVEYLHVSGENKDLEIRLKFKGKNEIKLNQFSDLNRYLSSGTIKGISTFVYALKTFQTGGYLIIDELENHFNHEIVSTLIHFYMDQKINPKGAVLVFSTHYPELLDEFDRNDQIYIVRNQNGICVRSLSEVLTRNDMKRSEAYQSGYLEGTTPMYSAYMKLKKSLIRIHEGG